jgi:ArsR family transcriptional regulator
MTGRGPAAMTLDPLTHLAGTLKVLSHPARLRLLAMLRSGGLCVCQAAAALGSPVSTVSEYLSELKRAGLLVERREGRWVTYSLAGAPEARALLQHVWDLIGDQAWVGKDARVVRKVRRLGREDLCHAGLEQEKFGFEPASG